MPSAENDARPPHEQHHPWGPLEAALVATLADWKVECDARPASGRGSDCSDLMDVALTRIKGLCSGALDPEAVITEAKEPHVIPPAKHQHAAPSIADRLAELYRLRAERTNDA